MSVKFLLCPEKIEERDLIWGGGAGYKKGIQEGLLKESMLGPKPEGRNRESRTQNKRLWWEGPSKAKGWRRAMCLERREPGKQRPDEAQRQVGRALTCGYVKYITLDPMNKGTPVMA